MARQAKNPGVGRGHGTREPNKQVVCTICGVEFAAKRSDTKYCPNCRVQVTKEHGQRSRPERHEHPGSGRGAYPRSDRRCVCQRCFAIFWAKRTDAKWCPECRPKVDAERASTHESRAKQPCPKCGAPTSRGGAQCRACAGKERAELVGEANPNWRGGRTRTSQGYVAIRRQRGNASYTLEHIAVWEDLNGPLPRGWNVHHLNGTKDDNRPENLVGMSKSDHHSSRGLVPYMERIQTLEEHVQQLEEQLRALQR